MGKKTGKPDPVLWSYGNGQQIACFDSCRLTIPKWATKVIETLFDIEALILTILFASVLCRCCGLCSLRNRKINVVLGEGGNVSKILKNQISLSSVSTLVTH